MSDAASSPSVWAAVPDFEPLAVDENIFVGTVEKIIGDNYVLTNVCVGQDPMVPTQTYAIGEHFISNVRYLYWLIFIQG